MEYSVTGVEGLSKEEKIRIISLELAIQQADIDTSPLSIAKIYERYITTGNTKENDE